MKAVIVGTLVSVFGATLPASAARPDVRVVTAVSVARDGTVAFATNPYTWETGGAPPTVFTIRSGRTTAVFGGRRCEPFFAMLDEARSPGACLGDPLGVAFDRGGNLFVGDQNPGRILRLGADGSRGVFDGRPVQYPGGTPTSTPCWGWPMERCPLTNGLAATVDGSIVVADIFSSQMIRIDQNGRRTLIGGTGTCGQIPNEGADAKSADLCPVKVAAMPDGSVVVFERDHKTGSGLRLTRISPDGSYRVLLRPCTAAIPCVIDIATSKAGDIFVIAHPLTRSENIFVGVASTAGIRGVFAARATALAIGPAGEIVYGAAGSVYRRATSGRITRLF